MNKQLKEVIHFYIGQEVKCGITSTATLRMERDYKNTISVKQVLGNDEYKLLLRPLSDMTEEEAIEITKPIAFYGNHTSERIYRTYRNPFGDLIVSWGESLKEKYLPMKETHFNTQQFLYILKHGFDIFNLIPEKLAIDKTKMK